LFARVAAETFQQGKYFIKQDILVKHIETFLHKLPAGDQAGDIDGEVVLKAIEMQHGIFVERAQKIYSFSHLTFQEYFTAKYIADNPKAIKELMQHCTDKRWREVFLLTASLLDEENADEFFAEFQQAVVQLVRDDATLVELLHWARDKSMETKSFYELAVIRNVYIFLTHDSLRLPLGIAEALNPGYLSSFLNFALANAYEIHFSHINFAFALLVIPNSARDLDTTFFYLASIIPDGLKLPTFLKIDYSLAMALLVTRRLSRSDNDEFQKVRDKIPKVARLCSELINKCQEFPKLHAELQNLTLPNENDRQSVWQEFEKQLRDIMQRHRNIGHEWNLTKEQSGKLDSYLEANELLVECLKLAMVSDRKVIEDRVLLLTD